MRRARFENTLHAVHSKDRPVAPSERYYSARKPKRAANKIVPVRRTHRLAWMLGLAVASAFVLEAIASPSTSRSPSPTVTPSAAVISDLAPADEYFGHAHLSIVRIHHQVFALKDDIHHQRGRPDAILHETDDLNDAYLDWANRFPKDRWLPRTGWELATLYEELPGAAARDRAVALLNYLQNRFQSSPFAVESRKELARGVGIRPWPQGAGVDATRASTVAITDSPSLLQAIKNVETKSAASSSPDDGGVKAAQNLETTFRTLSRDGSNAGYARCAWELAALYQFLPGEDARDGAIRMLALVLDRYPKTEFATWSMRDLRRGVGVRV